MDYAMATAIDIRRCADALHVVAGPPPMSWASKGFGEAAHHRAHATVDGMRLRTPSGRWPAAALRSARPAERVWAG